MGPVGKVLPYFYAAAGIVLVWQAVVTFTSAHVAILPPPALAAETFIELVATGEIFIHIQASLGRVIAAWAIAALVAVPLGLAMGRWQRFEHIVDPVVELFRPISPLAWIPLAILWFGISETGKIFIIFVATFFPILLNTVSGVKSVDSVLIRAGQVLGCEDEWSIFRKVILPASMPTIIVGFRIAFGTGWAAIIAAELVAATVWTGLPDRGRHGDIAVRPGARRHGCNRCPWRFDRCRIPHRIPPL